MPAQTEPRETQVNLLFLMLMELQRVALKLMFVPHPVEPGLPRPEFPRLQPEAK